MRPLLTVTLVAALLGSAAAAGPYKAPRTRDGAPDLQGLWSNASATMLQRPPTLKTLVLKEADAAAYEKSLNTMFTAALGPAGNIDIDMPLPVVKQAPEIEWMVDPVHVVRVDGQPRSSQIVEPADGQLPLTAAARKAAKPYPQLSLKADDPEARPLEERCLTGPFRQEGPPMVGLLLGPPIQLLQTRDHVIILTEFTHDARIVRLKDSRHPPAAVRPWMGDSIGRWEGETLVIETTNLPPKAALVAMPLLVAFSPDAKVTERLTRTAGDTILYQFTVDDPAVFTAPWRAEMSWSAAQGPLYESACHEGNRSLPNILGGARVQERAAAAATGNPAPASSQAR
jgi:hypothetical protein